ncbi:MAG: endolytic transglycosylase MltG [Actinomycetes bacterium]
MILVILVILVGALGIGTFAYFTSRPPELDFPAHTATAEIDFTISPGESGSEIARALSKAGIVRTWEAFFNVAAADKRSLSLQPGTRRIHAHQVSNLVLEELLDPSRLVGVVRIPEGARISNVIKIMVGQGFDEKEILAAIEDAKTPWGSVEGALFPATYAFPRDTTAQSAIAQMIQTTKRALGELQVEERARAADFTTLQVLTIASLIQAEADEPDFSKVSRVIYNRLADGMRLQLDTTVLYALKEQGRIRVTNKDLTVNSPFNTYKQNGLPPGPIGNPGSKAINAALSPADGPWIFFITVKPGDTRFTASENEFYRWKSEYQKNYAAGAFKVGA